MTLPDERYRAVIQTEKFLKDLCDPSKTPRLPRTIRQQALSLLRHYPGVWDMDRASHCCGDVFESPNKLDDLQIFLVQGQRKGK